MSVTALGQYEGTTQDVVGVFPAPLLYVAWDEHLMFCAPHCIPAPPDAPFGEFIQGLWGQVYGEHPDFARIQWDRAQWYLNGEFWFPKPALSLAENGIGHKDVIRLRTPELNGIAGSGS